MTSQTKKPNAPVSLDNHIRNVRAKIKTIEDGDKLIPLEVLNMGLIVDKNLKPAYWSLYRLLKSGRIKAYNKTAGEFPSYIISGRSLKDYLRKVYGIKS